ncbi:transaldolase [Moraxella sp. RCAD0137]|uniref:transaldolase n=1 Tax=Moraxella sp. RCAD0137 TaxID=1775913 RepID=UPI000C9EEEF4|nr:transaldolase [Moraxella sp. RCAD0137]PNP99055.1 transaldolase [Moraxella sp. RCAD0137]
MNSLEQLSQLTTIVADTGDLSAIARLKPVDATTNPSLITAAFASGEHDELLSQIKGLDTDTAIDTLTVALGHLISTLIQGRVSTEVDARLSFDTDATIAKAYDYIDRYAKLGVDKERVLIKIASTWQGIKAAEQLEKQGIHCNLTLLFTDTQARACADAGVTLISPFVGRITDWQKAHENRQDIAINEDMGVNSVKSIYQFYKSHGYHTQVMGASFRSIEQIIALAGCDLLTISPALLDELANSQLPVTRQLIQNSEISTKPTPLSQADFEQAQDAHPLNSLLIKGIDGFVAAREKLVEQLAGL